MPQRLVSLDVFRGLTVALMILVNNPGSWAHVYPPLRHAHWHGWTPTDLVFPFFLFIVGVAMALSFARRRSAGAGRGGLVRKILARAAAIFLLGLFLNGFPFTGGAGQWSGLRLWGVLQRIAACYLLVGLIVVLLSRHRDRILAGMLLLVVYELGMRLPLVPDWGAGSFALPDNFARWLDLRLWGEAHLYTGAGIPFDPEGLWSTLPAAETTLAGFFTGQYLRHSGRTGPKTRNLAVLGVALFAAGQALNLLEPVNKQLWTTSYVVLTAGLALLVLAFSIWAMDIRHWDRWIRPAVVFGSNALVVFVGSGILARLLYLIKVTGADGRTVSLKHWLYSSIFLPWAGPTGGSLLYAVVFVLFWLGVLWVLYSRKIFCKI